MFYRVMRMNKNSFSKFFKPSARGRVWWLFSLVIIFTVIVGLASGGQYYNRFSDWLSGKTNKIVTLPKTKELPFRLGLDLQGGTQLVYEADVNNIPEADRMSSLEGVRDVIERRVNAFGVAEPVIQVNKTISGKYRIIAELAGVKDVKEAIKMIGETPLLEFKEQGSGDTSTLTAEEKNQITAFNLQSKTKADKVLASIATSTNVDFEKLAKENNQVTQLNNDANSPTTEDNGDLGWVDATSYPEIASAVKGLSAGSILKKVIDTPSGYIILKLDEKRMKDNPFKDEKNKAQKIEEYKVHRILFPKISESDLASIKGGDWKNTELTGKYLKRATVQFNPNDGSPEVSLEFNPDGAKLFEDITGRNVGKPVAIFLDGYPISAPNVNEKIVGGKAVISGKFTVQESKLLVQRLNTGALPVAISLVSQQTVGASLGQKSIDSSLLAGIIGFILVSLFMILYYRLPGLLSVLSLAVYAMAVLSVFKVMPLWTALVFIALLVLLFILVFKEINVFDGLLSVLLFLVIIIFLFVYALKSVTLTLSGLAGFILSIGMAVDANVLIFERMKEELKLGKPLSAAVDEGFKRAWPSIRDGNVTTILTCFVLMTFGTGLIKGFGTTLFIGVSVSMFSGIVVTRTLLKLIAGKYLEKHPWWLGVKK